MQTIEAKKGNGTLPKPLKPFSISEVPAGGIVFISEYHLILMWNTCLQPTLSFTIVLKRIAPTIVFPCTSRILEENVVLTGVSSEKAGTTHNNPSWLFKARAMHAWKIYNWKGSPALHPRLFKKSTRSPWVSPEWDRCNKARRPLGRVKDKHRDVRGGRWELSIIHWRCRLTHVCSATGTKKQPSHTHACLSSFHDRTSLMILALRGPLRGSKAALTPTTDSAGHTEALKRLYFTR